MKILYFHQHFSSPLGSTGIRSYCMSRCLLERGHKVTLVCGSYLGAKTGLAGPFINGQRRGIVDGIEVIEFELNYANIDGFIKRTKIFISYVFRGLKLIFSENYDVIFGNTKYYANTWFQALLRASITISNSMILSLAGYDVD